MKKTVLFFLIYGFGLTVANSFQRAADLGIKIGILNKGSFNSITDVEGVMVGQVTIQNDSVNTGVTAILPHGDNLFTNKVPAAIYVGNGFGKLAGITQVNELGNIETPIILTNTLNVSTAVSGVVSYILNLPGNENVRSVNAVVGETNDGGLNDIRGRHVTESHVLEAISLAKTGPVDEGTVGAGTGTICFGFKGGIGTSSRVLPQTVGGYTVGVLVQTNFGGVLEINGAPVGQELGKYYLQDAVDNNPDGSCMIVVATDAPVTNRNLERIAKRAIFGIARTGGIASNGSGDYVIAFSTNKELRLVNDKSNLRSFIELDNNAMSPLFLAAIEATEEAIVNSLLMATVIPNTNIPELPTDKLMDILRKYGKVK
jgi:D-aminopeptidase